MPNHNSQPLIAYVNGHFLPLDEATVHIEDRGFQFADGVYEVVACFNGTYLDLEPHLKRLERSCQAISIEPPFTLAEMRQWIEHLYAMNNIPCAMIYIQITRGVAARAHYTREKLTPTVVMTLRKLPQPTHEKIQAGLTTITMQDIRWKRCDIKSIAMLASVMGKYEAVAQGADETIWLDEENHVLEGCSTNLFAIIDGALVTHPLDHQVLGGITRDMVIRLAKANHLEVQERQWTLDEQGLSEVMLSSTTNAIMPITRINHQPLLEGKPGARTLQIRQWMIEELDKLAAS
ncbi:MAG: aminotransferase class IV [Zetaproteobacteria bacterium]|nr:aminotransferase class IV [Zetaproteobacteria bacterium]